MTKVHRHTKHRHQPCKIERSLTKAVCEYVQCVSDNAVYGSDAKVAVFVEEGREQELSKTIVDEFFPHLLVSYRVIPIAVTYKQAVGIIRNAYQRGVRRFVLVLRSQIMIDAFLKACSKFPDASFINTASTLPPLRNASLPENVHFSLQTDDIFIPQAFQLRPSQVNTWLVTSNAPDAYQQYVISVAQSFDITVVTPAQLPSVSEQIQQAEIVYVNLFTEAEQLQTATSLPSTIAASIVFLDIPVRSSTVLDAFPASVFQIVTYSPGCGTTTYEQSAWSRATAPTYAAFPRTAVMSVYYYLSFLKKWDTFIVRDIVVRRSVDYPFLIVFNNRFV